MRAPPALPLPPLLLLLLLPITSSSSSFWPPDELSDTITCSSLSIDPDLISYRTSVSIPDTYATKFDDGVFAPIFSSLPLTSSNSSVTLASIFVHGLSANANEYFCNGLASAPSNVLVVAPWFGDEQCKLSEWVDGADSSDTSMSTFWNITNWDRGGDASPGDTTPSRYTTSFDVLDAIVLALDDAKTSGRMPNLERVTINGFSAGAQLASRWALFSSYANLREELSVDVRTVVADGSSCVRASGAQRSEAKQNDASHSAK